jgi:hypothetical protein
VIERASAVAGIFRLSAITAAALGLAVLEAGAAESTYTPLDRGKCRHQAGKEVEDYGVWRCKGFAGVGIYVTAGDQRSYVSFGWNAAREPAAKQTFAAFNSEGRTVEWRWERSAGGKIRSFATIVRWNTVVSADAEPVRGQILVVTRLGPGAVCHVGYVDARANADAATLAQRIADQNAPGFRCGTDKPVILGIKGRGFSEPSGGSGE